MDSTFQWIVSLLLAALTCLLSIIVGMVVWIFRGVIKRLDRLETSLERAIRLYNLSMAEVVTSLLTLQLEIHPEQGEAIRKVFGDLAKMLNRIS